MTELLVLLLGVATVSLVITLVTHRAVRIVCARRVAPGRSPGISVLKPLKGLEDGLYENLLSIVQQDYPLFEILIGTEEPDDPALLVARRVQREFPGVSIKIFSRARRIGLNPKVNNLAMLSAHARFDHQLISDANVRAAPGYLRAMAAELDEDVGLVSSVLSGIGDDTWGARLENLQLNTFIASAICGADVLANHPCVVGKSVLFRRSQLDHLGGWEGLSNVLAEDYLMGRAYHDAGLRVALSPHVLTTINSRRSLRQFAERHLRWNQMRRRINAPLYFSEPLLNPVPWFIAALVVAYLGHAAERFERALLFAVCFGVIVKCISDARVYKALTGSMPSVKLLAAVPLKDFVVLGLWAIGAVKQRVNWRGNAMRIGPGSTLHPIEPAAWRVLEA